MGFARGVVMVEMAVRLIMPMLRCVRRGVVRMRCHRTAISIAFRETCPCRLAISASRKLSAVITRFAILLYYNIRLRVQVQNVSFSVEPNGPKRCKTSGKVADDGKARDETGDRQDHGTAGVEQGLRELAAFEQQHRIE